MATGEERPVRAVSRRVKRRWRGRHGAARHGEAWLGGVWRGTAWHGMAGRHGMARLGSAGLGWSGPGWVWQGTAGRGRARLCMAWLGLPRPGRPGQAWRGRVRHGVAGQCLAGQGVAGRGEVLFHQHRRGYQWFTNGGEAYYWVCWRRKSVRDWRRSRSGTTGTSARFMSCVTHATPSHRSIRVSSGMTRLPASDIASNRLLRF